MAKIVLTKETVGIGVTGLGINVVDKDLAIIVDLKGTAVEKKTLVGGIKQVDVMEPSVVKGGINALLELVLFS